MRSAILHRNSAISEWFCMALIEAMDAEVQAVLFAFLAFAFLASAAALLAFLAHAARCSAVIVSSARLPHNASALGAVPAENSIGEHASVVFFGRELIAESLLSRTPPATPVERRQRRGSKRDERALAIPPCGGSPTVRMREECVALRRAAVVAMVQGVP
jgi:hypothetical protein